MDEQSILLVLVILGGLILKFSLQIVILYRKMSAFVASTMKTFFSSRTPLGQGKLLKHQGCFCLLRKPPLPVFLVSVP